MEISKNRKIEIQNEKTALFYKNKLGISIDENENDFPNFRESRIENKSEIHLTTPCQ